MKSKEEIMRTLNITEEEYNVLMADDKRIDRGEKLFELADELKAGAKKARQADRKPSVSKRERKEDADKRTLIAEFAAVVGEVDILNPEREFLFMYNGRKYKLTLSCPRSQGQDFFLCKLPIDKCLRMWYNLAGRILAHRPEFRVNRQFQQFLSQFFGYFVYCIFPKM